MLVIIPIIAGLLACMPVPVGDPERSRIDPAMNGWWVMTDEDGDAALCVLRPYDKRTWLVIRVSIEKGDAAEIDQLEIKTAGDMLTVLGTTRVGAQGIVGTSPAVYKSWLTRIGGELFMTWEPVGEIDDKESFAPEAWFVFKLSEKPGDHFELKMLNAEYHGFEDLIDELEDTGANPWKVRKQWERVIRRHVDDADLYADEITQFRRLPNDLVPQSASLIAWPFDY